MKDEVTILDKFLDLFGLYTTKTVKANRMAGYAWASGTEHGHLAKTNLRRLETRNESGTPRANYG